MLKSDVLMVKEMMAVAGCKGRLGARQNGANLRRAGDVGVRLQEYSSALVLPPSSSSLSSSSSPSSPPPSSFSFSLAVDPQGILCLLAKDTL